MTYKEKYFELLAAIQEMNRLSSFVRGAEIIGTHFAANDSKYTGTSSKHPKTKEYKVALKIVRAHLQGRK